VGVSVLENLPVILVVEDDPLIQGIVAEAEAGFEIVIASSGEQAMELLDTSEGKFQALVTDINLGRDSLSGWEIARHAREIDPAFPVVYMSGDSAEDWASKGVPHSIMLAKPFAPAQLVTAVSQTSQHGYADKLKAVPQLAATFISNRFPCWPVSDWPFGRISALRAWVIIGEARYTETSCKGAE
jgi:DNA-binding response OmpR family regulator